MQGRNDRHYQRGGDDRGGGYQGGGDRGGDRRGRGQPFGSPRKSGVAAPAKGPIVLITNNFRIRSRNHGIIHTYRVDFIEGQAAAQDQKGATFPEDLSVLLKLSKNTRSSTLIPNS